MALKAASFHVRNLETRLPFRYGIVTLTRFPLLKGLAHCSPREHNLATRLHRDLYCGDGGSARLRIESGFIRVGSLSAPGYGSPFEPDLSSMIPLERWSFASLESMS